MNNNIKNKKNSGKKSKEFLIEFRNDEVISRLINTSYEILTGAQLLRNINSDKKKSKNIIKKQINLTKKKK